MRITLTIPGFVPHGGIRVILEWANGLTKLGHDVSLLCKAYETCKWFKIDKRVNIYSNPDVVLPSTDIFVICSPHSIDLEKHPHAPNKVFIFMQMLEHYFSPNDPGWIQSCNKFYLSRHPLISISRWNIEHLKKLGRKSPTYYIGNGINQKDFPIKKCSKRGNVVLVEGWEVNNPSKDSNLIAHSVANQLKKDGCTILAYSQSELKTYPDIPDEYHRLPSLKKINELYERADILLKASHYDARSTSPIEAMTKGCIPIRAIDKGDDDLVHFVNCLRSGYNAHEMYANAKLVLNDKRLKAELSKNCLEYVRNNTWSHHIVGIERILTS